MGGGDQSVFFHCTNNRGHPSLRKHPLSSATKSEEKRMFSQATDILVTVGQQNEVKRKVT